MANDFLMREQAEEALRKSELRFRTLVGAVSAITWSCPSSGLHVEPQPEWMEFTGQTAEEVLGDGWTRAVHPEDRATAASAWIEAVAQGEPHASQQRVRRHDGEWRWMSVRAVPIRNEEGEIVEWFGMCIDITEHKRAMEALHESEERFRLFMDNSPAIAWMKDEGGRHVYVNGTLGRRFGVQRSERLGKTDSELWPPQVAAEFQKNDRAALAADRPLEVIEEAPNPDGSKSFWLNTKFRFHDAAGKRYVGGIGLDITEHKRMEAALRASERRFRAIFNHQFEFSGLVDVDGRIIELSELIFRGTGVAIEEAIGKPFLHGPWWRDLPETRARWQAQFEEALAEPSPSRGEIEYRTSDGETGYVLSAVTALRDEQGELEYFLVEGLDITDRKRAENALRGSEERLRLALEASRAVNWSWDAASNVSTWDDRFHAHYELPLEASRNFETWIERVHPEDRPRILSRLEQMRATPGDDKWDQEFRSLSAEGRVRWHQNLGQAQRDVRGAIAGFVGIDLDITERKRAENALRESEERLRRVSDNADVGLVRCGRDWIYRSANPAYAKIVGKSLDQIIGRPLAEVMGAKAAETIRPYIERVLRGEHGLIRSPGAI